jgi:hypothetical protein
MSNDALLLVAALVLMSFSMAPALAQTVARIDFESVGRASCATSFAIFTRGKPYRPAWSIPRDQRSAYVAAGPLLMGFISDTFATSVLHSCVLSCN